MRRRRLAFVLGISCVVGIAAVAACVGDDPVASAVDAGGGDSPASAQDQFVAQQDAPSNPGNDSGGGGGDAASDAALRKCQTITPPPAPNDFFCADFDGTSLSEGWTRTNQPDAGTLSLTQTVFASAPNALNSLGLVRDAFAPFGTTVEWEKLGATTIRDVDLKFDFNPVAPGGVFPATTGDVELVTLVIGGTGNATVTHSLRHTRGKDVTGSGAHNGLYLFSSFVGGAATATSDLITTQPTAGSFTTVRMFVQSNGAVTISYNGVQIYTKQIYTFTESKARVTLGAAASGPTAIQETFRFDNVIVQVDRN